MQEKLPLSADLSALTGGGEMGALMRAKDWAKTRLGPLESWPQRLLTTASSCLNSRFPMFVWWGRDLVMLYNDAYKVILGAKHPNALGTAGVEVWPEIWEIGVGAQRGARHGQRI